MKRRRHKKKMTWKDIPQVEEKKSREDSQSWSERSYGEGTGYDLRFGTTAKYKKVK